MSLFGGGIIKLVNKISNFFRDESHPKKTEN